MVQLDDHRPIPDGTPIAELAMRRDGLGLLETPEAELVAERDRVDKAWELWSMPRPPAEGSVEEAKQTIARRVDAARAELTEALKVADRDDLADLHPRVALVALEADKLLSDLAELDGAA